MQLITYLSGKKDRLILLILLLAYSAVSIKVSGQRQENNIFPNTSAYIVVTGMKLIEDPKNFVKDISVAEGAVVKLTMKNGAASQKQTSKFISVRDPRDVYYTADFKIEFDSTYTIEMTFRNGTKIMVDNYKISPQWKTHFYFHSTNGTKSPATVMRRQEDKATNLNCIIYGLYPFNNYKEVGGTQFTD
jgi:hypothetical protein